MATSSAPLSLPASPRSVARGDWRFWALAAVTDASVLTLGTLAVVSLGVLPLYESVWWWDVAMHVACSAAIVGWSFRRRVPPRAALGLLLLVSVGWEALEYATPHFVLMAGGLRDTLGDVASNVGGWVLVTAVRRWATRLDA